MVKRKLILVVFTILFSNSVDAQHKLVDHYEVFAGVGLVSYYGMGTYYLDKAPRFSGTFGVLGVHSFSKVFKMSVGLSYDQRGFSSRDTVISITSNEKQTEQREKKFNFLTMTVIPAIQVGGKFKIGVGVYYALRLKAWGSYTSYDKNGNVLVSVSGDASYGNLTYDCGIIGNVSYRVRIGKHEFDLRAQENLVLADYANNFGYDLRSGFTSIVVSYHLPLK